MAAAASIGISGLDDPIGDVDKSQYVVLCITKLNLLNPFVPLFYVMNVITDVVYNRDIAQGPQRVNQRVVNE